MTRPTCLRCLRPGALCICGAIEPVDNRTEVILLQHPGERRHPFGTAIIARLSLAHIRFDVHWNTRKPLELAHQLPSGAALLYPGPTARSLAEVPPAERPTALVVLDGTWWGAKKLLKSNPVLAALPRVTLPFDGTAGHKLRREPALGYMSTIEAIHTALRLIEPTTRGLDSLMKAYDRLIDGHLEERAKRRDSRHKERARG
jgi:DTW domain-containing protein